MTHKTVDLDKIAKRKDCDILLKFGGAELIVQYRAENALREGHPFIDIVTVPGADQPMTVDLCDDDGALVKHAEAPIFQILLGQRVR